MADSEKTLANFTDILGVSIEGALAIASSDLWFQANKTKEDVKRIITYETDPTGTKVVKVTKVSEGGIEVDKSFNDVVRKPAEIKGGLLAAVLFSVNGNKNPFLEVKKFLDAGGNADTDIKKQFLAHCAWFNGSGGIDGWGVKDDPLVIKELEVNSSFTMPNSSDGNKLFTSDAFTTFSEVVSKNNNQRITDNLVMDLNRANTFLNALSPATGGMNVIKKTKSKHKTRKTKKTKKTKKKTRKY